MLPPPPASKNLRNSYNANNFSSDVGKQLLFANNRNGVRWAVLCLSQDGACIDLFENHSENSLKPDLSNDTTANPPLFSLVNTFKVRWKPYLDAALLDRAGHLGGGLGEQRLPLILWLGGGQLGHRSRRQEPALRHCTCHTRGLLGTAQPDKKDVTGTKERLWCEKQRLVLSSPASKDFLRPLRGVGKIREPRTRCQE